MVVSMSGVHLSVISIDVGSVWEVVFEAIRRKEAKWIGVSDYTKELTNAVLDTSHDGTLHVSVGTADFVTP